MPEAPARPAAASALMRRLAVCLASVAALMLTVPPAAALALSPRDSADVARIEAYLNSIRTLRSSFVQVSSGGESAEGTVFIERPGRLRLDYSDPPNIEVYVDGNWLVHVDTDLEAVSQIPVKWTPARFLVSERIALSGDATVRRIYRGPGVISVELVQTGDPEAGSFELAFFDAPLALSKWVVVDSQGVTTTVTLAGPVFNVPIPREVFVFDSRRFEPEPQ